MKTPPIGETGSETPVLPDDDPTLLHVSDNRDCEQIELAFLTPSDRDGVLGCLDHYEVLEVLGQGGFGIVLRAFDTVLQRIVAVKVLAPEMAATSPARKRFLREARASAQIRHENVVQVYAIEETPLPYLVMEYIPGQTLQERIDTVGPLATDEAVRIGTELARGLAAAHERGLIHRDVKPNNVLLEQGPGGRAKLTDFGLARAADDASLTQSGAVLGTPMYMAPEQARGEPLDHRADLFSLGSIIYAMVTGRPPFRAADGMSVLKRVCEDTPRPIREVIPEVPQWLSNVVGKLHEKNPEDRYQSANEVADALAKWQTEMQTPDKSSSPVAALAIKPADEKVGGRTAGRSNQRKWAIAALVLLPALALGITRFTGRANRLGDRTPTSTPMNSDAMTRSVTQEPPRAVVPFDEKSAKAHQEAWAMRLGVEVEVTNSIGMKLRLIPPGEFSMGMTPAEIETVSKTRFTGWNVWAQYAGPVQDVTVSVPYYMGQHEVTVGQFRKFTEASGYKTLAETDGKGGSHWSKGKTEQRIEWTWSSPPFPQTEDHPAIHISWNDARAFCEWLSKTEGRRYVLPSEEQWEYACRAGSAGSWCFGNDGGLMSEYGVVQTLKATEPVGHRKPNGFGLFDMHGNALEWCNDSWIPHRAEPDRSSVEHPAAEDKFVQRGGSFVMHRIASRSGFRAAQSHTQNGSAEGFRIALVMDLKTKTPSAIAPFENANANDK